MRPPIVAIVGSDPPEDFDRWTLRLIKEKAIKNDVADAISRETIRVILEKHDLKTWHQRSWCVPDLDDEFILRKANPAIGKAKKIRREGHFPADDFKEIKVAHDSSSSPMGACSGIEMVWDNGRLIRFSELHQLIDFLKKAS